jgi:hypothetical protein
MVGVYTVCDVICVALIYQREKQGNMPKETVRDLMGLLERITNEYPHVCDLVVEVQIAGLGKGQHGLGEIYE